MEERVILDPVEVAIEDRKELNLHSGAIQIREEGPDWGDTAIEAFMAQRQVGEAMIDYRLPNRTITIPLILGGPSGSDFGTARQQLQAKVSRINEEGGWLKREVEGEHGFFDLVKATLKLSGGTQQAQQGFDPAAELILEALPEFYGDLIILGSHEGTGYLSFTEQIKGNLPGRVDLTVTEKGGANQLGLGAAFRCRNYTGAASAAWTYECESLELLDTATKTALTGSYGGQTVKHPGLGTSWTPILGTSIGGATFLTHVGLYDLWIRVYTTSASLPWLRFVYDVGDLISPTEGPGVQLPAANGFYLVPLGQVNLRPAPMGAHRWAGVLQGYGEDGGENVYADQLWLFPADESSAILRGASQVPSIGGTAEYLARDAFNQEEGPLTGRAAEVGGNWSGAGDADDFKVIA